jgi:hypothetical protein
MENFEEMLFKARTHGNLTLRPGVWLQTSSSLADEQVGWSDDDPSKNLDCYSSGYWITTDSGTAPVAIRTPEDLRDFCEQHDIDA